MCGTHRRCQTVNRSLESNGRTGKGSLIVEEVEGNWREREKKNPPQPLWEGGFGDEAY